MENWFSFNANAWKNVVGTENVGIRLDPYESEANQNETEDPSDFEDDSFSSSSRSSLVSNAPSVQHFNISVCCVTIATF